MRSASSNDRRQDDCRLWVGTSGYSYAEWRDAGFYPPETRPGEMLHRYAASFAATELNFTWYQMPKAAVVEGLCRQVPERFRFAAKLNRCLTHEIETDRWRSHAARYRDGIAPLVQTGQLAAVLLQFPPTFRREAANRRYLAQLLDALDGLPLAVEFRHASWAADRVYAALEQRRVTLVTVDVPAIDGLFPCRAVVTNRDFFYIRFHGRNARGWRSGNLQKQFDYDYSEAELTAWADGAVTAMAQTAHSGLLFFNNHVRAQAPRNAAHLAARLARNGLTVVRP